MNGTEIGNKMRTYTVVTIATKYIHTISAMDTNCSVFQNTESNKVGGKSSTSPSTLFICMCILVGAGIA
jgi:hypothetical protein